MRLVNIMLGSGKGGLEQAALDYAEMLASRGHGCLTVVTQGSWIQSRLEALELPVLPIRQWGTWDVWAVWHLRERIYEFAPEIVIAHGNRAASLGRKAIYKRIPFVTVAHNYRFKPLLEADHIFAVAPDVAKALVDTLTPQIPHVAEDMVTIIPNTVRLDAQKDFSKGKEHRGHGEKAPMVGGLGRLEPQKGFDTFLKALALLKKEGIPFRACLGGEGSQQDMLKTLAQTLDIAEDITFLGWVDKKDAFFEKIDIFCLPSLHEPFGIVLLEAFAAGKPVVSSAVSGPLSMGQHNHNLLFFNKGDVEELAKMLKVLLTSPEKCYQLAQQGYHTAYKRYSFDHVACVLEQALSALLPVRRAVPLMGTTLGS